MNKVRNLITATAMMAILLVGTSFANGGIIIAGYTDKPTEPEPCTEQRTTKYDSGIIVTDLTGIIIAGFTGIIIAGYTGIDVAGATKKEPVNCGIIIAG